MCLLIRLLPKARTRSWVCHLQVNFRPPAVRCRGMSLIKVGVWFLTLKCESFTQRKNWRRPGKIRNTGHRLLGQEELQENILEMWAECYLTWIITEVKRWTGENLQQCQHQSIWKLNQVITLLVWQHVTFNTQLWVNKCKEPRYEYS